MNAIRGLPARWVISDTHFGQRDLDVIFDRPSNWEELTVNAWKEGVGPEDTVLHLGDVADTRPRKDLLPMLAGLPGRVILVPGNWDSDGHLDGFRELGWQLKRGLLAREYRGWTVFFTHEPMDVDELEGHKAVGAGALNVHGHQHRSPQVSPWHINITLELMDYQPRLLKDILDERIDGAAAR